MLARILLSVHNCPKTDNLDIIKALKINILTYWHIH